MCVICVCSEGICVSVCVCCEHIPLCVYCMQVCAVLVHSCV